MWLLFVVLLPAVLASEDSSPFLCITAIQSLVNTFLDPNASAAERLAAFEIINLSGKSINDLGSHLDCNVHSGTHYCLVRATTPGFGPVGNVTLFIGLCVPDVCTGPDLRLVITLLLASQNITFPSEDLFSSCEVPKVEVDASRIAFLAILGILCLLILVGTAISYVDVVYSKNRPTEEISRNLIDNQNTEPLPRSKWTEFVLCWSLISNWPRLFAPVPEDTKILNGVRVLSMCYVILGHVVVFKILAPIINPQALLIEFQSLSFQAIPGAFLAVDSFYFLSGFLVCYYTAKELEKGSINWLAYFFHRWWRLTPIYMFIIFFYTTWVSALPTGPLRYALPINQHDPGCSKYWWTNLIYLNNFIPWDTNLASGCLPWGWYMANDFQMFILSALVLAIWKWNRPCGVVSSFALILSGWVVCIVLTLVYHIKFDFTSMDFADWIYTKPWSRTPPYFIGNLLALFWIAPKEQRGYLNPVLRAIGYPVAAILLLVTAYGTYGSSYNLVPQWNTAQNVFFITFSRSGFVSGLAILCYFGFHGYGSIVTYFLSSHFWGPLARLTYLAYLLHPILILSAFFSIETTSAVTPLTVSINFVAFTFASYAAAAVVWLLIEKPLMNVEKLWIPHFVAFRESQRSGR